MKVNKRVNSYNEGKVEMLEDLSINIYDLSKENTPTSE